MADAPSTPAAGAVPASPKLLLPPMTVSPGVTRLDRVLDLVTDHEAQFRDHELRVVDLSARVAAVERAVGGTEARSVALADGTPYGAYPDGEHPNDETPPDLRSEMATTKASVADLRLEFAEALREVRSEMRSLVDDAKAQKAGFKRVLRDVLDRVAGQLDAVRARQGTAVTDDGERERERIHGAGRSASDARKTSAGGESFASAAELAALAERVSLAETVAERAGTAALSPSRDVIKTRRLSETERRVDALAEELRRLRDDGDDLRARVALPSSSFSIAEDELPWKKESRGSSLEHSVADDAVAEQLRALARRFDEQREETEALKRVVLGTRGLRNDVVSRSGGKAMTRSPQRSPMMRSPQRSPQRSPSHSTSFRSPRVSSDARRRDADDGLIRLGFGAYAGASLTASSDTKRTTNALPRNAGFVAEASARLRKTKADRKNGSASRMEDPDAASAAFREYLARLPEAVAEAAKEKTFRG